MRRRATSTFEVGAVFPLVKIGIVECSANLAGRSPCFSNRRMSGHLCMLYPLFTNLHNKEIPVQTIGNLANIENPY